MAIEELTYLEKLKDPVENYLQELKMKVRKQKKDAKKSPNKSGLLE